MVDGLRLEPVCRLLPLAGALRRVAGWLLAECLSLLLLAAMLAA
jgi:hypothetical protein